MLRSLILCGIIFSTLVACGSPNQTVIHTPGLDQPSEPAQPTGIVILPTPTLPTMVEPPLATPPRPINEEYAPQRGDEKLSRGEVYLAEASLAVMESYPVQIGLYLSGELSNPCSHLRVRVFEPDTENKISIDVYSVSDPAAICIQIVQPFDVSMNLGSFPTGHYTVWVNDELIGEFDS